MPAYKYGIALRIQHPTKNLSELQEELGSLPGFIKKRIWKYGEPRTAPRGQPMPGTFKQSYCYLNFGEKEVFADTETLPEALKRAVALLQTKEGLIKHHQNDGTEFKLYASWIFKDNSGDTLSAELLRDISHLGLSLEFDVYPETEFSKNDGRKKNNEVSHN
jgi:hypothetical protein